jgi:hypothetical protein
LLLLFSASRSLPLSSPSAFDLVAEGHLRPLRAGQIIWGHLASLEGGKNLIPRPDWLLLSLLLCLPPLGGLALALVDDGHLKLLHAAQVVPDHLAGLEGGQNLIPLDVVLLLLDLLDLLLQELGLCLVLCSRSLTVQLLCSSADKSHRSHYFLL